MEYGTHKVNDMQRTHPTYGDDRLAIIFFINNLRGLRLSGRPSNMWMIFGIERPENRTEQWWDRDNQNQNKDTISFENYDDH